MARYRLPLPPQLAAATDEDAPERIAAYLASQGISAQVSVSLPTRGTLLPLTDRSGGITVSVAEPEPPALLIEADADPTAALAAYQEQPSPRQVARAQLRAYRDKVSNNEPVTAQETARAVAALINAFERRDPA